MSSQVHAHAPVGGELWTRPFQLLVAIAALGGVMAAWRFAAGLAAVSNLNDGYPWGIWIAFDVVTGTALGCGGYAVALLVYVLNRGEYHPLVRPALLTSLLGYGLAVLAVTIDLGRPWELWKVPVYFWRWSHSPQLEVALCVATYVGVVLVELSPAAFEKWRDGSHPGLRSLAARAAGPVGKAMPFIIALGLLLPTMHQSSLGTMMLLPGPRLHPLWFTPWLPLFFLVNCVLMGIGVVMVESHVSASAFGRRRETAMLASLGRVGAWVTWFFVALRVVDMAARGRLPALASWYGLAVLVELGLAAAGASLLMSDTRRRQPGGQVLAGLLLVTAGAVFRFNVYLVGFRPGSQWSYFPAVPELLITFGIVALEIALYVAAVRTFPILAGPPAPARA
ncbi:MAG TPA: Ni/Fe-hydrogenase cytochrome b subunit [Vicinamibacteria bacterium]|nr:Ni/Fe-hydrogenase cytochrome b subunit [Vicinamibacteria bacterium]